MDDDRDPYLWRRHALFARDLAARWLVSGSVALVAAAVWSRLQGVPVGPRIPQMLVLTGLVWAVFGGTTFGRVAELGSMAWGIDVRNERLLDPTARPARERSRLGVPAAEQFVLSPLGEGVFVGLPLVMLGGALA